MVALWVALVPHTSRAVDLWRLHGLSSRFSPAVEKKTLRLPGMSKCLKIVCMCPAIDCRPFQGRLPSLPGFTPALCQPVDQGHGVNQWMDIRIVSSPIFCIWIHFLIIQANGMSDNYSTAVIVLAFLKVLTEQTDQQHWYHEQSVLNSCGLPIPVMSKWPDCFCKMFWGGKKALCGQVANWAPLEHSGHIIWRGRGT